MSGIGRATLARVRIDPAQDVMSNWPTQSGRSMTACGRDGG
jgi:hypothetical protein